MSQYATAVEFETFGIKASGLQGLNSVDIDQALSNASDEADGYLAARYTLPISPPYPPALKKAVCSIAAWDLLSARGYQPEGSRDPVAERAKAGREWLSNVSAGRISPAIGDATAATSDFTADVATTTPRGI